MKQLIKYIYILFVFIVQSLNAQVSPTIYVDGINHSSGFHTYCSYGCLISPSTPSSPVSINGTADVTYAAGTCIQLLSGFSVSSLTGTGKFKTQLTTQDFPVVFTVPNIGPTTQVGLYEKVELGLDLPSIIDNLVIDYFASNSDPLAVNPFNPQDISINAVFESPNGVEDRDIFGFYYEDFDYDLSGNVILWSDKPTPYNFRVRFAPTELGQWDCHIRVVSPNGKFLPYTVDCIKFECVPSGNKGYLEVGLHKRQLKFSGTGESFFAIGQNIPWIKRLPISTYYYTNMFNADMFNDYYNEVKNLADNDGNFFRNVMSPSSYFIEWEKLGDYGKTNQLIAIPSSSGITVDVTQNRQHNAFELDKLFDLCEQRDVFMDLNLEMHNSYNDPLYSWEPKFEHWEFNPYKRQVSSVTDPLDVLTDATAKKYYKQKLRYIIARWGYSTSLGVIEMLSEQDAWKNYAFTSSATTDMYNWHAEMINYIKTTLGDKNHLFSTSFADRSGSVFALTSIDVTSGHKYSSARDVNYKDRFNYMNENPATGTTNGLLVDYDKPSIFGELGMASSFDASGNAEQDIGDVEGCNDYSFHNALWSTAFMGCYGTGLNWWQEYNDVYRADNFPPLKAFFNGIDFETNKFAYPEHWRNFVVPTRNYFWEVFQIRNFDHEKIMGWAHNATYYWGNTTPCADHNGNFLIANISDHNDDSYTTPTTIVGDKVIIKEAKILKKYNIDWFDTRSTSTTPYSSGTKWSNLIGRLKPYYPGTEPDLSFQAYLDGTSFRSNETSPPSIDTLLCGEDTISVDGAFDDDVNGLYSYFWNFGNGQTSNLIHPTIIYQPGTYNASLIVTDTIGYSDTLSQIIYVPNCDSINNRRFAPQETDPSYSDNTDNLYIDPNPNNGEFTLTLKLSSEENYTLEIIDSRGKIIYTMQGRQSKININLSDKNNGLYILKLSNKNGILYKKFIKQ